MDDSDEPFGPYDFPQLLTAFEHLLDRHTVAIVGGQALNVWATYYDDQVHDELAWFAPYTSKDIDCYGNLEAAQALGDVLTGEVYAPHPDAERDDAHREVVDIAKALLTWAGRNLAALGIYERGLGDPLAALSALLDHPGWDRRFRERELKVRFERVVQRRETRRVEAGRKQAGRPT